MSEKEYYEQSIVKIISKIDRVDLLILLKQTNIKYFEKC